MLFFKIARLVSIWLDLLLCWRYVGVRVRSLRDVVDWLVSYGVVTLGGDGLLVLRFSVAGTFLVGWG